MNIYNYRLELIFCHKCRQSVRFGVETYFDGEEDDPHRAIRCGNRGCDTLLGYQKDLPVGWMENMIYFHCVKCGTHNHHKIIPFEDSYKLICSDCGETSIQIEMEGKK